jgi:predicted aminopeptidase
VGTTKVQRGEPNQKSYSDWLKRNRLEDTDENHYKFYDDIDNAEEVWSLPITDAMRAEATTKGFPLFTGGAPMGMFGGREKKE